MSFLTILTSTTTCQMPYTGRTGTHTGRTQPEPSQNPSDPTRFIITPLTWQQILSNFQRLQTCTYVPTLLFDLGAIESLGVGSDFATMTQRIGIYPIFWTTRYNFMASPCLTIEFFSSVKYIEGPGRTQYLLFQLGNQNHTVGFTELRIFFRFHTRLIYDKRRFNRRYHVDDFWESIIGRWGHGEYKTQSIKHLVIRCIQRALALTIFARNGDADKVTMEEIKLLDLMLDPKGDMERPDLMFHMVRH
jgi:ATHILA ORF-1 family